MKRIISTVIAVVMLMYFLPMLNNIALAANLTLAEVQNKFPTGAYWNHADARGVSNNRQDGISYTPCSGKHSSEGEDATCNGYGTLNDKGVWTSAQCRGFVDKVTYDIYGKASSNWTKFTKTGMNLAEYEKNIKPGDVLIIEQSGKGLDHAVFVTAVDGDVLTIGEANYDNHCRIRWDYPLIKTGIRSDGTGIYKWGSYENINVYSIRSAPSTLSGATNNTASISPKTTPTPPTNVKAVKASANTAKISWNAVSGATSYEVQYYSQSASAWKADSDYKNKSSTSYISTGLGLYDSYRYRVRAVNSAGASSWTEITYTKTTPPIAKNKPGSTSVSTSKSSYTVGENIVINWTAATEATTYSVGVFQNTRAVRGMEKNDTSWTISDLSEGTYEVQVYGINANGNGTTAKCSFTVTTKKDDIDITNISKNMVVNVGAGSTLRFCSTVSTADSSHIGSIPNAATVYVYGFTTQKYENRTWAKINYNGKDGWVNSEWLKDSTSYGTVTIQYNANGGSGAPSSHTATKDSSGGVKFSLSTAKPTRSGYTFLGWRLENSTAYGIDNSGQSINIGLGEPSKNVTLTYYAQWSSDTTYTITYDANGGTGAPPSQMKKSGESWTVSSIEPTRKGYTFKGWAESPDTKIAVYFSGTTLARQRNMTLYAVWAESVEPPSSPPTVSFWRFEAEWEPLYSKIPGTDNSYNFKYTFGCRGATYADRPIEKSGIVLLNGNMQIIVERANTVQYNSTNYTAGLALHEIVFISNNGVNENVIHRNIEAALVDGQTYYWYMFTLCDGRRFESELQSFTFKLPF